MAIFVVSPEMPLSQLRIRQLDLILVHIALIIALVHFIAGQYGDVSAFAPLFGMALVLSTLYNITSIRLSHRMSPWIKIILNLGTLVFAGLAGFSSLIRAAAAAQDNARQAVNILDARTGGSTPDQNLTWMKMDASDETGPNQFQNAMVIMPLMLIGPIAVESFVIHFYLFVRLCVAIHRQRTAGKLPAKLDGQV